MTTGELLGLQQMLGMVGAAEEEARAVEVQIVTDWLMQNPKHHLAATWHETHERLYGLKRTLQAAYAVKR